MKAKHIDDVANKCFFFYYYQTLLIILWIFRSESHPPLFKNIETILFDGFMVVSVIWRRFIKHVLYKLDVYYFSW